MPKKDLCILAILLAFPSTGFVQKYSGLAGVVVYLAVVAALLYAIWRVGPSLGAWFRRQFRPLTFLAFTLLAIIFAIVHPIENSKGLGKSSDRDDGLNIAVARMADGLSPYYPHNEIAGPLSVLPGSVILAAPFVGLGDSSYQNFFWLAVFLCVLSRFYHDKGLALILLLVTLAISPSIQYEYISGGDLLANGIFVALFLVFVLQSWNSPDCPRWWRWAACVLLGLGFASRPNFLLLAPLLGAALWRVVGFRQALVASCVVVAVAAVITVPFYLNDPAGFTPLLARQKMAIVNGAIPEAGMAMIVSTALVGLIAACIFLRSQSANPNRLFFRWCTVVTLWPMACAVTLFSMVHGEIDFSFMHDRFGLMYVFFALLGWGDSLLKRNPPIAITN